MDLTAPPLQSIIADASGKLPSAFPAWSTFFQKLHLIVNASCQSGTTANRPTQGLYVGRRYFDTTLTYPVWVQSVGPPVVWCNASGAAV